MTSDLTTTTTTMMMKQRRPWHSIDTAADTGSREGNNLYLTHDSRMKHRLRQRRRRGWREIRLVRYLARATLLALFLSFILVGFTTRHRMFQPNGAEAEAIQESSYEPPSDDKLQTYVLCSYELNAYCPSNTRCCPKYQQGKQTSGRKFTSSSGESSIVATSIESYTCLPSSSGHNPPGLCCATEIQGGDSIILGSGCAVGYKCAAPISSSLNSSTKQISSLSQAPHCIKDDSSTPVDLHGRPINNLFEYTPRYITCPAFSLQDISTPYGLPIPLSAASYHDYHASPSQVMGLLAYYSNMGPLISPSTGTTTETQVPNSGVKTAVIAIHGSGRDALSYLCAIIAAVGTIEDHTAMSSSFTTTWVQDVFHLLDSSQDAIRAIARRRNLRTTPNKRQDTNVEITAPKEGEILTIAPRFLSPADGQPKSSSNLPFLQWNDDFPIAHSFRYGAESEEVPILNQDGSNESKTASISSFAALDVLVETLCNRTNYPNLDNIIVVGHSAGGQVVHRWGLSSDSWCFGDGKVEDSHATIMNLPSIRLVAANPRSYAYLDKRRYFPTSTNSSEKSRMLRDDNMISWNDTISPFDALEFRLPTDDEREDCPEYNKYIWGLDDNSRLPAPYITSRINKFLSRGDEDGRTDFFCRYAFRNVVYLSGERDIEKLGNQIVDGDGYQGPSRRERSERFYASLQALGAEDMPSCRKSGERYSSESDDKIGGKMQVHSRIVVENVGHDHTLIFQSPEGLSSMFSEPTT